MTGRADVVLPVAPVVEKAGTFLDWEGRLRTFVETLRSTGAMTDGRVLDALADELGVELGAADGGGDPARAGPGAGTTRRPRSADPSVAAAEPARAGQP